MFVFGCDNENNLRLVVRAISLRKQTFASENSRHLIKYLLFDIAFQIVFCYRCRCQWNWLIKSMRSTTLTTSFTTLSTSQIRSEMRRVLHIRQVEDVS